MRPGVRRAVMRWAAVLPRYGVKLIPTLRLPVVGSPIPDSHCLHKAGHCSCRLERCAMAVSVWRGILNLHIVRSSLGAGPGFGGRFSAAHAATMGLDESLPSWWSTAATFEAGCVACLCRPRAGAGLVRVRCDRRRLAARRRLSIRRRADYCRLGTPAPRHRCRRLPVSRRGGSALRNALGMAHCV